MSKKLISCHIHDYVEIACMYGFEVELIMNDESRVSGKAKTVKLNEKKTECLVLQTDGELILIPLNQAKSMRALVKNPHFDQIEF